MSITYQKVCYRCGKMATRMEKDDKGDTTGKLICNSCYMLKYRYGTYDKPKKCYKDICYRCIEGNEITDKSVLSPGNRRREKDKHGNITGRWICHNHWKRDWQKNNLNSDHNIIRSIADRRTGNLRQNSSQAKGDKGEELLCRWKGYINLNKIYDNYRYPIDCFDEETGLYYQAKIAYYNNIYGRWSQDFKSLQNSVKIGFRFKSLYLFCISEDRVERIYEIPEEEVIKRSGITISKYDQKGKLYNYGWYEKYRITDKDELEKVNIIWQEMKENR